jgi:hypothetical protein
MDNFFRFGDKALPLQELHHQQQVHLNFDAWLIFFERNRIKSRKEFMFYKRRP